jgi:CHAT domain-containing protein
MVFKIITLLSSRFASPPPLSRVPTSEAIGYYVSARASMKAEVVGRQKKISHLVGVIFLAAASASTQENVSVEPAEPKPSTSVQQILEESDRLTAAGQLEKALQATEQAVARAETEKDVAGRACATRSRALALQALGRNDAAIGAWRDTATAWESAGDVPGVIEALATTGLLLMPEKSAEAEALFTRMLALAGREAARPSAASQKLHAAARLSYGRKYFGLAAGFWAAAASIDEKTAPNSLQLAEAIQGMGSVAYQQGDIEKASQHYERALALRQKLAADSLEMAVSLNAVGNVARKQGDLAKAQRYYEQAIALRQKLAPGSLEVASSLNSLGNLVLDEGDLEKAAQYYRQSLMLRQKLAPDSLAVSESLHKLADVVTEQGDYAAAEEYHRQALALARKLAPDSPDVASSLVSLGTIARKRGRIGSALDDYQQALALRQKLVPDSLLVAQTLSDLGNLALQQGNLPQAEQYHQQALAIRQKLSPDSLSVAASLNSLGSLAAKRHDLAKAEGYHQQALAINQKLSPDSITVAHNLGLLGDTAVKQGDLTKASQYYQDGFVLKEKLVPNSLSAAVSLYNLSLTAAKEGDQEKAEQLARQAWELVRNQAAVITGDEARQAFDKTAARYADNLILRQLAIGKPEASFVTLEQSRAQALEELLIEKHVLTNLAAGSRWSEYESALAARDQSEKALSQASADELRAREALAARHREKNDPEAVSRAHDDLETAVKNLDEAESVYTQARMRADELWADIKKNAPRAFTLPLTFDEARKEVPAGAVFATFHSGDKQTVLFLLRSGCDCPSPLSAYTLKMRRKEMRSLVSSFRQTMAKPNNVELATAAGRDLFAILFPPEARPILDSATRLIVSPDGPLWEVPFAALVTNTEGAPIYLGSQKGISYTPSLTLFAQSRHDAPRDAAGHKATALVVGNPFFAPEPVSESKLRRVRSYMCFGETQPPPALPGTGVEAVKVAALYDSAPLLGKDATEAALRKRIESVDVVHLATHGCSDPRRAMLSGLLLAAPAKRSPAGGTPSGDTDNDGVLQAWEIYSQLKLKAELVVLSACDTGRGESVAGEGLIGLTRALEYAGARSVVSSLWTADDQSTLTLMVAFHRNLRTGDAKDEALRRAMESVRRDPRSSHPYYWAAFYLTGDPDNPTLGNPSIRN